LKWIQTAKVNEQNAPNGTTDQGVAWQSLGVFTITADMLHVSTWNSPTDGAICVDGVRIIPTSALVATVSAADAAPALLESGRSQFSSAENGFDKNGTVPLDSYKAIDPQAVDSIDLPAVAEQEMGHFLGPADLDASLDLLVGDPLGAGDGRVAS
jgi:hypothetical protein